MDCSSAIPAPFSGSPDTLSNRLFSSRFTLSLMTFKLVEIISNLINHQSVIAFNKSRNIRYSSSLYCTFEWSRPRQSENITRQINKKNQRYVLNPQATSASHKTCIWGIQVNWTKTCWTVSNLTNDSLTNGQLNNGQLPKLLIKQRSTEQIRHLVNWTTANWTCKKWVVWINYGLAQISRAFSQGAKSPHQKKEFHV